MKFQFYSKKEGTGFSKPWGFSVFPWLLGSVVVTVFGSDATSYHGDWGVVTGSRWLSTAVTVATRQRVFSV